MARSKLPSGKLFHDSGFRFRRLGNTKTRFSISVRMPADDGHEDWWWSTPKRVELEKPDGKAELLSLAEAYRWELMHPKEAAAQRAVEEAGKLTVAGYTERWRQMRRDAVTSGNLRESTVERDEVELRRIGEYLGDVPLADLDRETIEAAYLKMSEDGVSKYTRARTATKLKAVLRQARIDGIVAHNVADDVSKAVKPKPPKPDKARQDERAVTSKEADALMAEIMREAEPTVVKDDDGNVVDVVDGKIDGVRVAVWLARNLGLRRGEVLGLVWDDIDDEEGVVHVRRAQGKQGVQETKTYGSMRDLPLTLPVWRYLAKWRERQKAQFAAGFRERDGRGRLLRDGDGSFVVKPKRWSESVNVVTNGDGNAYRVDNFARSMRSFFVERGLGVWTGRTEFKAALKHVDGSDMRATRGTGYRGVSLKSFRSLMLSEMAMSGVPVATLQAIAGHTKPETSLKYYVKATPENMREALTGLAAAHVATELDTGVHGEDGMQVHEAFVEDEESGRFDG